MTAPPRVGRSTALMFATFAAAAVFDYAYAAGMSWVLPPESFGRLSVALSYFLLLSLFAGNGFPLSLSKVMAESPTPPRGLVRLAIAGNVAVASVVVTLFLVATRVGPLAVGAEYRGLVLGVAAAVMLLSVGSTLQYALQGRMAFAAFGLLHASKSVNKLVFGVALVALGFGLPGAVGGLVVGAALLALGSGALLARDLKRAPRAPPLDAAARGRFLRYTGAVLAGSLALTLLMNLDVLGVKYLVPAGEADRLVGQFQSASVLAKAPLWGVVAGLGVAFPLFSRAARSGDEAAATLVRRVLRWTLLAIGPAVVALAIFPREALLLVFPASYAPAAPAVAVSAIGMGALAVAFVLTRALQATGRARRPGAFLALSAGAQVALLVVLVPRWGILGAAGATAVASAAGALLALAAASRAFALRARPRDAAAYVASLGALVMTVAAMRPDGRVATLVAFALGSAAYALGIVASGLVRDDERRRLAALMRGAGTSGAVAAASSEPARGDA